MSLQGAHEVKDTHGQSKRDSAGTDPLPFSEYLARQAEDSTRPKRERTRSRFKAGAAKILETEGYHGLQMSGVCKQLGLSQGSIYNYFKDKKALALEVLSEFADRQFGMLLDVHPTGDVFARVYQVNLEYVQFILKNIGLFRCMRQLGDELPEFTELWNRKNYGWCLLVARSLQNRTGSHDWNTALALARVLGSMVDEVIHEVFLRRSPELAGLADSPEELAEMLSILWYRMAYAANPRSSALPEGHPLLDIQLGEQGTE